MKRQKGQRLASKTSSTVPTPRTSQALRKAAPISAKRARKLETKKLHARNRAIESALEAGEVEMRDVSSKEKKVEKAGSIDTTEDHRAQEVEMKDV